MKVSLSEQIEVITSLRDAWEGIAAEGAAISGVPDSRRMADVLNGAVLTLTLMQANEPEYREFLAQRKTAQ